MKEYLLDTNCILRFLLRDNLHQASIIKQYFQNAKDGKVKIYIPLLVFVEAIFILTRLYHLQKTDVIDKLTTLADLTYLEIEKRSILIPALFMYGRANISIVDLIFMVEASQTGKELLTFDKRLKKLKIDE